MVKEEDEDEEDGKATEEREEEREKWRWREREEELLRVERLNHQHALQALETQANEELQSERQRLLTQHKLQLGNHHTSYRMFFANLKVKIRYKTY